MPGLLSGLRRASPPRGVEANRATPALAEEGGRHCLAGWAALENSARMLLASRFPAWQQQNVVRTAFVVEGAHEVDHRLSAGGEGQGRDGQILRVFERKHIVSSVYLWRTT